MSEILESTISNIDVEISTEDNTYTAIILAGGFGTRLREAVPELPKVLAPVAGRPFLAHIIDYLRMEGVNRFIFSLGYMWGTIESFLRREYPTLDYTTVIEETPLGTGGGISHAVESCRRKNVVVVNGDTLYRAPIKELFDFHVNTNAECTLALKPMQNFERYGVVEVNSNGVIQSFKEKQQYAEGLINGGIYVLNTELFKSRHLTGKFSFEKDYLEKYCTQDKFYGSVHNNYFIDIGIPIDYQQAQNDLTKPILDLGKVDNSWTLFLDRDGVINDERVGEYVLNWSEFVFSKGVLDSFKLLSQRFGKILIISNQRGVGKGLMSRETLDSIHLEMQREVAIVGASIDKIYYCTATEDKSFFRKPNPGMAYLAKQEFPGIDISKSIMVGNKPTDMKFGKSAGMYTVFVTTTNPGQSFPHPDIDLLFPTLLDFAKEFSK
jgi:D-glycero-alpha-D-manno-heptose 1-phosphate guanylyltransferase